MKTFPLSHQIELSDADDATLRDMKETMRRQFNFFKNDYDADECSAAAACALAFTAICTEERERGRIKRAAHKPALKG